MRGWHACGAVMLALSDESLARFAIAATGSPRSERRQWLQSIASKLEPLPAKPGARRVAAWRARKRAGRVVLRLELDEAALVVGLVDAGLLNPLAADD